MTQTKNIFFGRWESDFKICLQAAQNKCIRFCLKLGYRKNTTVKELEKINWLPTHERVNQCILSFICKFYAKIEPDYVDEIFPMHSTTEFLHVTPIKN